MEVTLDGPRPGEGEHFNFGPRRSDGVNYGYASGPPGGFWEVRIPSLDSVDEREQIGDPGHYLGKINSSNTGIPITGKVNFCQET